MNDQPNPSVSPARARILKAALAIGVAVLAYAAYRFPDWREDWTYHFHQNQQIHAKIDEAEAVFPFVNPDSTLEDHVQYQDLLIQAGAIRKLMEDYRAYEEQSTRQAFAQALLARVTGDRGERAQLVERAAAREPSEPAVLLVQLELALRDCQFGRANELLEQLPGDSWIKPYYRAQMDQQLGEPADALDGYREAMAVPGAPQYLALACGKMMTEEMRADGTGFDPFAGWSEDKVLETPLAFAFRSWIRNERVETLEPSFPGVVRYDPAALAAFARLAARQGSYDLAERLLDQAAGMEPGYPDIHVYRGILARARGESESASEWFNATEPPPNMEPIRLFWNARAGYLLWFEGERESAVVRLAAAGEAVPPILPLYAAAARRHAENGDCESARPFLPGMEPHASRNPVTLFNLGAAFEACGEAGKAIDFFAAALDRDFELAEARRRLANLYADQGDKIQAISMYDNYIKRRPDYAPAYLEAAKIHLMFEDEQTALRILEYVMQNKANMEETGGALDLYYQLRGEDAEEGE